MTNTPPEYPLADEPAHTYRPNGTTPPPVHQIPVYMPPNNPKPPKRWSLFRLIFRTLISIIFLTSIIANLFFISFFNDGIYFDTYRMGDNPQHKIALLELNDTISMESAEFFRKSLDKVIADKTVKGIILVINSPGGAVNPSDMIADKIQSAKTQSNKPIYAVIQQVGASGAYWIASAADTIYGRRHSIIGSIGVIYMNMVVEEALKNKLGVDPIIITSSRSPKKDHGSPFRKPSEEEIISIQSDLDTIHRSFVETIARNRNLPTDQVWDLADGDVYDGQESLSNHLIDKLGTLDSAIKDMTNDLGLANPVIIRCRHQENLLNMIGTYHHSQLFDLNEQIKSFWKTPRIQAIWPGY